MRGDEIRRTFLRFFEERDHRLVPSSSLIPPPETGLLLTTAGMVQFVPFFLGVEKPPTPRATSVQKAFRTTDIEDVGDVRHQTFFEMLGNFSFGDYFKREAIRYAWELSLGSFGLDPSRIWVTVYDGDDESADLWLSETDIPSERIQRRGKVDNFWGIPAGPGGPNTELFYDRGPEFGPEGGPDADEDRFLEYYNLVFIQYRLDDDENVVGDLPGKNVDTGMGLERMAAILQDAPSTFETDLFEPIIRKAEELTGARLDGLEAEVRLLRILADHARATTFLIADGVTPSNEGRGYVLRRLLRRAITEARQAGVDTDVLHPLCSTVAEHFRDAYPEIGRSEQAILEIVGHEEQRFGQTLDAGLAILTDALASSKGRLAGDIAFKLHDTYGFPLEITLDVATKTGLEVDVAEFDRLMAEQRTKSMAARVSVGAEVDATLSVDTASTEFLGYDRIEAPGNVVTIFKGGVRSPTISEGEEGLIVLNRTPFYAEGGGQVGDQGVVESGEAAAVVLDTTRSGERWLHRVRVTSGEFTEGDEVEARVDRALRAGAERAHTATHILHHTLRDTIGTHVRQMGSLVEPGRLHFDFSHFAAVPREILDEVEETANRRVGADDDVVYRYLPYDQAIAAGALAFFEEKYGDQVRVVEVGDYSRELCGGTHVHHTGNIGFVKILGESSIGSNIRRVEALTGIEGLRWVNRRLRAAERAAELVRSPSEELVAGIERLIATQKDLQRQLEQQRRAGVGEALGELARQARDEPKGKLVVAKRSEDVGVLRELAAAVRDKLGSSVVVLGTAGDGRANLVAAVTKGLADAREILRPAAERIGGGAGGKPELATAGGRDVGGIDEALAVATTRAQEALS